MKERERIPAVTNAKAALFVPGEVGVALAGDAAGGDLAGRTACRVNGSGDGRGSTLGNGIGVLFHEARLWIEAFQRAVAMATQTAFVVDDDSFAAAGALIDAEEEFHRC